MLFYLYNIENIAGKAFYYYAGLQKFFSVVFFTELILADFAKRLESLFAESRVEELGEPYS